MSSLVDRINTQTPGESRLHIAASFLWRYSCSAKVQNAQRMKNVLLKENVLFEI